jgi:hypothetical protein
MPQASCTKHARGIEKLASRAVAATEAPTLAAAKTRRLGDSDLLVSRKFRSPGNRRLQYSLLLDYGGAMLLCGHRLDWVLNSYNCYLISKARRPPDSIVASRDIRLKVLGFDVVHMNSLENRL